MANNQDEDVPAGAARTVEIYHIEEAVRQAQLSRSRLTVRIPLRDRQGV
jgi:hypothetical protein